jgi:4-alpha-glucanotransferase
MYEKAYDYLLKTLSGEQWGKIGNKRRSGVAVPLFSVYSSNSIGIGDFADLSLLVDWCNATGISIIQLLPVNDVGFNFRPYDAQSTFALDPMYLALEQLIDVSLKPFKNEIKKIRKSFPAGKERIDYRIKRAKLNLLWKIFETSDASRDPSFERFRRDNAFWLEDYALFKVIKEKNNEMAWEGWSEDLKHKQVETVCSIKETYSDNLVFQKWLQWQSFEQFRKAKKYANEHSILLMGDLPFLVSRDSADVWSHQDYFKLWLAAGAPPDMLYSKGQRWGMPAYNWENISRNDYDYLKEKLKYAENFYDLYRIDHVVGIFRVWTIPLSESMEYGGLRGAFDPLDENLWEEHGRTLLSVMIKNTNMLACAEDLGTIPPCTFKVLEELGIPGIDVQRWIRDWDKSYDFKDPGLYRKTAAATIATHDMSSLWAWWLFEAGTVDEELFKRKCREKNIPFENIAPKIFDLDKTLHDRLHWKQEITDPNELFYRMGIDGSQAKDIADLYLGTYGENGKFLKFLGIEESSVEEKNPSNFIKRVLEKVSESSSIYSIQLLHDWLSLDSLFDIDPWELRINFPGTISDKNWSFVLPLSIEDMLAMPVNIVIKKINEQTQRI